MYDVSAKHRQTLEENEIRLKALEKLFPEDYFKQDEYRKICEQNRQARHSIETYDKMISRGVKFYL